MVPVDRHSNIPIYKQIYEDINLRIEQGEYSLGSMLPSESKLCSMYGVERATIRKALALMVDDGKIARIPGLGTSVLNPADPVDSCKKRTLLFLLPKWNDIDLISEPFNAKLMETLDHECSERGYALLYKPLSSKDTADNLMQTCNPCGVFFLSSLSSEVYHALHRKGMPIVLLNQSHPLNPSVCLDNRGGAKMVTEYLLSKGHRQIGFVGVASKHQTIANRFQGYKETLEKSGVSVNEDWVVNGDWSMESGREAMRQLMKRGKLPTAIFAANDAMAIGAIMEAHDSGLSVPKDISVVGFDNVDQSSYIRPSLTTVAVDYSAMSRTACMLMTELIERGGDLNVNIYVPLNLIDRESARPIEPLTSPPPG